MDSPLPHVTAEQVAAAQLRLALDEKLGRQTPEVVRRIAAMTGGDRDTPDPSQVSPATMPANPDPVSQETHVGASADPQSILSVDDGPEGDLPHEWHQALVKGLADLPDHQRNLLMLLAADPPLSYTEISKRLHIPTGSIGPTRARALSRLRQHPAVVAWMLLDATSEAGR